MNAAVIILIIVVVVLLVAVVMLGAQVAQRKRSAQLQEKFGPEYELSVRRAGDRRTAEAELKERQDRRDRLDVRDLTPDERGRFSNSWESVQRGFVDDPAGALQDADVLVVEIMRARGYPVNDFDRRADDISVDHPEIVHHYRDARSVRDESAGGMVDTERQRRAITSYRALVEALLSHSHTNEEHSR